MLDVFSNLKPARTPIPQIIVRNAAALMRYFVSILFSVALFSIGSFIPQSFGIEYLKVKNLSDKSLYKVEKKMTIVHPPELSFYLHFNLFNSHVV